MCYSAFAVDNFFIEKAQKNDVSLSHMKLQKIVFFAHAIYFNNNAKPLISDPILAWQHGPVIESLYQALKQYGNNDITELLTKFEPCGTSSFFPCKVIVPKIPKEDKDVIDFLTKIWNKLSVIDTWRLRALSHAEGGAWYKTVESQNINPLNDEDVKNKLPRNLTILDDVIQTCGR